MPQVTLNGPVVPETAHNTVLREAFIHSPVERRPNATNYHVVEVGVREGIYTTWVGTWDQSTQKADAASPLRILDDGRRGMRLKAGQALVARVTANGTPASLTGCRVNFRLALVGGRSGDARPLVNSGVAVADPNTRVALATLERQINTGGLAEWDDSLALIDPVTLAGTGTFHGRLQRDSTTQISLQRFNGNWVEVDGEAVSLGSDGIECTSTDGLLTSTGGVSGTGPSSSTTYHAYVGLVSGTAQLRLSGTAPTRYLGTYYLGTDPGAKAWRFVGWVRVNGSTQFEDDTTNRGVVNYYNRLVKPVYLTPGYSDNNAATTWTTTSTTFTAANGGTGATGSYIANGEDAVRIRAVALVSNSGANSNFVGIGDNSATTAVVAGQADGTAIQGCTAVYSSVPAAGRRTVVLLVRVSGGTGTYYADVARGGSGADPAATYLVAEVMA